MRYAFLLPGWGIASPMFGRISFCLYMLDFVVHNKIIKIILWLSIVCQLLFNVATIVVVYSQCGSHFDAIWDPSISAHCLSPSVQTNVSYFQCGKFDIMSYPNAVRDWRAKAWNSFTDLYLTIIPAVLLRTLRIERVKKFTIIFLLSLSIL